MTSLVTIAGGQFTGNLTGYLNLNITGQVALGGSSTIGSIQIGDGASFASLTNEPGGFIDLDTSSDISFATGASAAYFVNDGTLLRNGNAGSSVVSVPFLNSGSMRITTGSVTFTDGFANSGTVEGRLTTNSDGTITWTFDPAARTALAASPIRTWASSTPAGRLPVPAISTGAVKPGSCGATPVATRSYGIPTGREVSPMRIWASSTPVGRLPGLAPLAATANLEFCGTTPTAIRSCGIPTARAVSPIGIWASSTPAGRLPGLAISAATANPGFCGVTPTAIQSCGIPPARAVSPMRIWALSTPAGRSLELAISAGTANPGFCGAIPMAIRSCGIRTAQAASPFKI